MLERERAQEKMEFFDHLQLRDHITRDTKLVLQTRDGAAPQLGLSTVCLLEGGEAWCAMCMQAK